MTMIFFSTVKKKRAIWIKFMAFYILLLLCFRLQVLTLMFPGSTQCCHFFVMTELYLAADFPNRTRTSLGMQARLIKARCERYRERGGRRERILAACLLTFKLIPLWLATLKRSVHEGYGQASGVEVVWGGRMSKGKEGWAFFLVFVFFKLSSRKYETLTFAKTSGWTERKKNLPG